MINFSIFCFRSSPFSPSIFPRDNGCVFLVTKLCTDFSSTFKIINVFQKEYPRGLFYVIEFARTTGILVENVIDMAANPLLQLDKNGVEVLLPIFDGLVQKVQRKKKELYVKAPEGLIDLYLG